jgi:hypothetical protein
LCVVFLIPFRKCRKSTLKLGHDGFLPNPFPFIIYPFMEQTTASFNTGPIIIIGMTLNVGKTSIISFTRKNFGFNFNYKLSNNPILRSQCVKDLGVLLDCKLYFHHHIDHISSQRLKCWTIMVWTNHTQRPRNISQISEKRLNERLNNF